MGALTLLLAAACAHWGNAAAAQDPAVPTPERALEIAAGLHAVADDPAELEPRVTAAWNAWRAAYDAYHGEAARTLAEAMHAVTAAPWSAEVLEGTCRRLGDYASADRVLAEQLQRPADPAVRRTLLERRAIVAAGAGWLEREREFLGRALAAGGPDAYQMLARRALAEGRLARARALFRALVERHLTTPAEAPPWALRGWGITLLPATEPPSARAPGKR